MSEATMHFSLGRRNGDDSGEEPESPAEHTLDTLRTELDTVDAALLDAVRQRLEVCLRIGELKRREHIPLMQPGRMDFVHERAREYADRHSLSPEFFDALYDLLIAETCRLEDLVINADAPSPDTNGRDHRENSPRTRHGADSSANAESR
nr:chorismate mutase family protein [Rhodococcus sp. WMMA185]